MTHSGSPDLADTAACDVAALYATRKASPVEVLQAVLRRIDAIDPRLNAFVRVDRDGALASARQSERRWQRNEPASPLDGVPVSIKDLILAGGMPTLRGSFSVDENQAWDVDAPVTARLREAGLVIVGKTTTPEFGCKGETNSPRTGITRNPWNPDRTSGGSSGGAAVAVATGMGPIAIGTDGAGSVRIPGAFCGTFGLKPSFGRVPAYPPSPYGTVAHIGPHTMNVRDAATVMNIMKRPDARDWTSLPFDAHDYTASLDGDLAGVRVAYSPRLGYARDVHPEVLAAIASVARDLQHLGARVEEIDPGIDDPLEISTGLWFLGSWTLWNTLSPAQQSRTDPDFRAQAEIGRTMTALQAQQLHMRRSALGSHLRQFMQRYDLILTPSVAIPAFPVRPPASVPMSPQTMLGWTPFTYPFNLSQQPACTIPCGFTSEGLPIGAQFVGGMFDDAMVLRAARAFETMHPIPRPPAHT